MGVLEFVSSSEFRKERARQLAKALLAELGVQGVIDTGLTADALLAALVEDLEGLVQQGARDAMRHAEALGLSTVGEAEAAATLRAAVDRVLATARRSLEARLADMEGVLDRMLARTSAEAVAASLRSGATAEALLAPIASLMASTAAGLVSTVESEIHMEAVATTQEQGDETGEGVMLWEWQTREDDKVCSDLFESSCDPRHGVALTLEEWEAFGTPGDPDAPTICAIFAKAGSNCRCRLVEAGSAASTPTPVKIAEAAKAGRQLALEEAA